MDGIRITSLLVHDDVPLPSIILLPAGNRKAAIMAIAITPPLFPVDLLSVLLKPSSELFDGTPP